MPPDYTDEFLRWYEVYPRHQARGDAAKAYGPSVERLRKDKRLAEKNPRLREIGHVAWLLEITKEFAESPAGRAGPYTPQPGKWLRGDRWADDRLTWWSDASEAQRQLIDPWDVPE